MEILEFDKLPSENFKAASVTIGNFDGVHRGHSELIKRTVESAKKLGIKSVVVTFDPHPAVYFQPSLAPPLISSRRLKESLVSELGVDGMLTLAFDKSLASLAPREYVEKILLKKLNAKVVWVGYDFTFGAQRKGTPKTLNQLAKQLGFDAYELEPQRVEGIIISSTKIREFLHEGKVAGAASLLGRLHTVSGMVIEGRGEGKRLGFPTINLHIEEGLIPKAGVYSGLALIEGKEYAAAINIGYNPTFAGSSFSVEAYILDFEGNLYGARVSLAFLQHLRSEIKFADSKDLAKQIAEDVETVKRECSAYLASPARPPIIWQ